MQRKLSAPSSVRSSATRCIRRVGRAGDDDASAAAIIHEMNATVLSLLLHHPADVADSLSAIGENYYYYYCHHAAGSARARAALVSTRRKTPPAEPHACHQRARQPTRAGAAGAAGAVRRRGELKRRYLFITCPSPVFARSCLCRTGTCRCRCSRAEHVSVNLSRGPTGPRLTRYHRLNSSVVTCSTCFPAP